MKLKKVLTSFGIVTIAASGLLNAPGAFAATAAPELDTDATSQAAIEQAETNAGKFWKGKLVTFSEKNTQRFAGVHGPKINQNVTATYDHGLDAAITYASPNWVWPGAGQTGPVVNFDNPNQPLCLETNTKYSVWAAACKVGAASQTWTMAWFDNAFTQGYGLKDHSGNFLNGGSTVTMSNGVSMADQILVEHAVPTDAPVVEVPVAPSVAVTAGAPATIKSGEQGKLKIELKNNGQTFKGATKFTYTAPANSTFASNRYNWKTGSATGSKQGTLSSDKKTLTVETPDFNITANATMFMDVDIIADNNAASGEQTGGSMRFGTNVVVPAGTTIPLSFFKDRAEVVVPEDSPLVVASPAVGGEFATGADGTVKPVFSGTATPGATVSVKTAWGDDQGSVVADAKGAWKLTWIKALHPGSYTGGMTTQFIDGKKVDAVGYSFSVKAAFSAPLVVRAPAVGGEFVVGASGTAAPVFSGTATPGAQVKVVTAWGDNVGTTTAAANGTWSITWNKTLLPNSYKGGHTIQSLNGAEQKVAYDFTVKAAPVAVSVTSPANGARIQAGADGRATPTFTGVGTDGATIKIVTAYGTNVGEAIVKNGAWSITWNIAIVATDYKNVRTLQYIDGKFANDVFTNFTVVK